MSEVKKSGHSHQQLQMQTGEDSRSICKTVGVCGKRKD